MIFHSLRASKLVALLITGGIGVIPTDTIYGISCSALNGKAVERVYAIRGRERTKPFIILISSLDDLALFGICPSSETRDILSSIWPAPVSVILSCLGKKFSYLHRGTKTLAFRVPDSTPLRTLLKKTGPLITTSVNPAEEKPATTIAQGKKYFGSQLDFYADVGKKSGSSSTIIRIGGDGITLLR